MKSWMLIFLFVLFSTPLTLNAVQGAEGFDWSVVDKKGKKDDVCSSMQGNVYKDSCNSSSSSTSK